MSEPDHNHPSQDDNAYGVVAGDALTDSKGIKKLVALADQLQSETNMILSSGEDGPVFVYTGIAYVRPVHRGIVLGGAGGIDLASVLEDGDYHLTIVVHKQVQP